ncbi:replication restart helicase PriA [Botrimarina hoheduenensis]|uniref:Replication restart protein PriA n=1 Tax=Botrimarina hoheduenensis TaxID=2528000 RepID=A0A5C5W008_9BACT|nr:primosomal protein N' [Botrimarina hoheduenensis]TWT43379.1 Primosomal protein N' [Botrimarina hoheduenensis]
MQQSLFDAEPPDWEIDSQQRRLVATIVLPGGVPGEFDYTVPAQFVDEKNRAKHVEPGRRVRVPFGRGSRSVAGYCVRLEHKEVSAGRRLKELIDVLDAESLVSPAMLRLTQWMADRYQTPWGQVLEAVVPSGVRGKAGTREVTLLSVPTKVAAQLTTLTLPPKQQAVLTALAARTGPLTAKQLCLLVGCTTGPINALRKQGLIASHVERVDTDAISAAAQEAPPREGPKTLSQDQQRTLDAVLSVIEAGKHQTILVHGVTGSGKTEVYLQAIERVVAFGRQAIVLVPEISLTPQTVRRFRERFDHIAVLHSRQSDVLRHRQWRSIARGEVQVVIGARSAVFAPTPRLGLIVIDEEHETSFKQDTAPRYHARDVALQRTAEERAPLVLGSATPALESWVAAQQGGGWLLTELPRRIADRPMPAVRLVDLRAESLRGALSRQLCQAMEHALRDSGQVILLLNRRGYSTHVRCPSCKNLVKCKHCDVAMTFHREDRTMLCHWCDYRCAPPSVCPDCRSPTIHYGGLGTQKLEDEVRARFPGIAVARMDADTTRGANSHELALDKFRLGETRVLLGTQMIAKGLDFPNVTLVGVVNADSALHLPDYRAAERTFQLVTQVAGRTGRGPRGGRVIVQTFDPEHPALQAAADHDFHRFAREELPERQALGYPPYGSLARVIARGSSEPLVKAYLEELEAYVRAGDPADSGLRLLGPAPAPIPRLRGEHRYHLLLRMPHSEPLRQAIAAGMGAVVLPDGVRSIVDIDPVDML